MPINDWSESIIIVRLADEPIFSEDMEALQQRIERPADSCPCVILDVQEVTYLNSSNIAQLLRARKKLNDTGSRLCVCALNDRVWSIMLVTGLDQLFEFAPDVGTALASLQIGDA